MTFGPGLLAQLQQKCQECDHFFQLEKKLTYVNSPCYICIFHTGDCGECERKLLPFWLWASACVLVVFFLCNRKDGVVEDHV